MQKNPHKYFPEFIYLFLIFFLCYTSVNKLTGLNSFRTNLIKTSLFTEATANWFSIVIIIVEIIVVLLMISSKKLGLIVATLMLVVFTLYISYLRYKGFYEVCGCGGILNGLEYKYHLTINIVLIFSGLYASLILYASKNEK